MPGPDGSFGNPASVPLVASIAQPTVPLDVHIISGVTRNSAGVPLGNCVVKCYDTVTDALIVTMLSDANGNYSAPVANGRKYYLVGFLAGSPDVAGTTDNNLTGTL